MSQKQARDQGSGRGLTVYAQLFLGMATFGSATPVSKIVTGALPVFVGSGLRVALGALALAPFALRHRHQIRDVSRRDWLLIALISLFGMFGFSALMLYGMAMVSGVAGAIVMSTAPAVTAAVSILLLGDRATWLKLTAIALAVGGVLLLHLGRTDGSGGEGGPGEDETLLLGSLLVFAAVCCEVAYTLLGKQVSERVDPVLVAFLAAALAVPAFLPFALWQWPQVDLSAVGWGAWAAVAWYGVGTLALGSWLWYAGIAKAEGTVAAAFMGVMPASALVLSYLLLGESFRWIHLAGFLTVFVGVLLMSWEHARMARAR
ncbi:MAG: DMT family transporter [Tistlia sp.]|uniref:DMT family transporter n=1 Tax=Tistlia sp. TaxID=3057121 RepID=UPI0034A3E448